MKTGACGFHFVSFRSISVALYHLNNVEALKKLVCDGNSVPGESRAPCQRQQPITEPCYRRSS